MSAVHQPLAKWPRGACGRTAAANHAELQGSAASFALVIPTLNPEPFLDRLIPAIKAQILQPNAFLVIDSESTDEGPARLQAAGATLHTIRRRDFDHGGTRQLAVEMLSNCPNILFMTQDAVPASAQTFARLLAALDSSEVGAAYGRQLPAPDATPIAAHARLFNYGSADQVRSWDDVGIHGIKAAFCSNSFATYRRRALVTAGGFPRRTIMSEDMMVAAALLRRGWRIRYVADARVYHSHNYTITEEMRRYFDTGVLHEVERELFAKFGPSEAEGWRFVRSELSYLLRQAPGSIPAAVLRSAAKFAGYRLGRAESILPLRMKRRLSLNRGYWESRAS